MMNQSKIMELRKNTNYDVKDFSEFDFQFQELGNTFNFINPLEVKTFIYKNKQFFDFFEEITPILKKQYPNNKFYLEYLVDPEIDDFDQIELIIKVDSKKEDLNSVMDNWRNLNRNLRGIERKYGLLIKFGTSVVSL